jgi:hypothetical protein
MHNFGNINNAFSEVLFESFIKKDAAKKKLFNTYLATIKESKILKTQYLIYKNISEKYDINDLKIGEYIKESISLMNSFKLNDIVSENKKLIKLIGETSKLLEYDYDVKELHENINNLIILGRTKNHKNINKIVESLDYIFNYIKNNKPVDEEQSINEGVANLAISKFNEKYGNLESDDFNTLKSIIDSSNDGKETTFKNTLGECVNLIDSKLTESDGETKDKLLKVKDKISKMSYNEETFIKDISKIIELKRNLN